MIFIYGHPASGKTTLATALEKKLSNSKRCGNDQSRLIMGESPTVTLKREKEIYALTAKRTQELLGEAILPLVDITFSTESKRNSFFEAENFELIPSIVIHVITPPEICRFRIQERYNEGYDPEVLTDISWFDVLLQETTIWNCGNHLSNYKLIDVCSVDGKYYTYNKPVNIKSDLDCLYNDVLAAL